MARSSTSWQPGQSGNVKGRPPNPACLTAVLREMGEKAREAKGGTKTTYIKMLAAILWRMALEGRDRFAMQFIANRLEGKAPSAMEKLLVDAQIGDDRKIIFTPLLGPHGTVLQCTQEDEDDSMGN